MTTVFHPETGTAKKKRDNREAKVQRQFVEWFQLQYPRAKLRGNIRDAGKMSPVAGYLAKLGGQTPGWPDIQIYTPSFLGDGHDYHGLAIELKDGDENLFRTSSGQRSVQFRKDDRTQRQIRQLVDLRKCGWYGDFACSFEEAVEITNWYFCGSNDDLPPFTTLPLNWPDYWA